jgi:hypothetical protein
MDVDDARQNYTQTYTLTRVVGAKATKLGGSMILKVPPANVGPRTTPFYNNTDPDSPEYGKAISGAASRAALDKYTKQTIYDLPSGETVFCGSREDSFFADTAGIFDLLNPRILASGGNGVDDFKGFNVLTYALRIPVSSLPGIGSNPVIGVYASVSRARTTLRQSSGDTQLGPWVQVNRMGNPLFNEVLVATADKDNYNRSHPTQDATLFAKYALKSEVAFLINFVYGTAFAVENRTDLKGIFIPDVLRVNTSTGSVPIPGEAAFNRLSVFGGDTTDGQASGWPNGRRHGDDVVDIALTAIATDLRTPIGPEHPVVYLGDNVDHNDQVYHQVFPYIATPWSGVFRRNDP